MPAWWQVRASRYAMEESIVSQRTLSVHKEHEFLLALEAAGLNDQLAQGVISSKGNELATKVVAFIQNGGHLTVIRAKSTHKATPSQMRALDVMGKNGRDIADVENYFGVEFTSEQKAALAEVPFSEKVLEECAATHILFPGFPLNLLEIRSRAPRDPKTFYSYENAWYNNQDFAQSQKVIVQWYLVRRDVVPESTSKTYDEQMKLLSKKHKEDWIPTACDLAYGLVLHFLATGERLLGLIYARTASVDSVGLRVGLGGFGSGGLGVDRWGDYAISYFGLASARKFN